MKLLLDENISDRIVARVRDLFPDSIHAKQAGLAGVSDEAVWAWAKSRDFAIVSKDTDFLQRAIAYGAPPKFIWLRIGNCPTAMITMLLRSKAEVIRRFNESGTTSVLVLERSISQ